MAAPLNVTQEEMAVYRSTARRRLDQRMRQVAARRACAWETAGQAARFLKERYGVCRVVVFGSLARDEPISFRSDIDLAVWGLDERVYYRVVSQLLGLHPAIEIDLVLAEDAPAGLLETIEKEGVVL